MNMNRTDVDYPKALGSLFHKMKGIKYWELIGDMSAAEMVLLHTLSETEDDRMQVGELTETLSMHPTAVSRLMNSLEKKGFIERSLHKENRRITDVSLTASGKVKSADNSRILNDYWNTVLSGLEREDLRDLYRVSQELLDRMEEVYLERKKSDQ